MRPWLNLAWPASYTKDLPNIQQYDESMSHTPEHNRAGEQSHKLPDLLIDQHRRLLSIPTVPFLGVFEQLPSGRSKEGFQNPVTPRQGFMNFFFLLP